MRESACLARMTRGRRETVAAGNGRAQGAGHPGGEHHRFYEALIAGGGQSLAILGAEATHPVCFGRGGQLLRDCLSGPDAASVAALLDALLKTGAAFTRAARTGDGRLVTLRGMPVGRRAVVYFRDRGMKRQGPSFREIAETLPVPVWTRRKDGSLAWGNRAFLAAAGAQAADAARWEGELAQAPLAGGMAEAVRDVSVGGQRRRLHMTLLAAPGGDVVGVATDVTAREESEARLRLAGEGFAGVIEALPVGVAVFDDRRRLVIHNSRYARLWGLAKDWLDTRPTQDDIFDRLRAEKRLPEQKDFADWKRAQQQPLPPSGIQALWHLPGGRCVSVTARPHREGGRMVLFEDVSERLVLETSLNLLLQVQKATLDTLDEGTAIFAPNGRLILHNGHFAALWRLAEAELLRQPHLSEIARLCAARGGPDDIWTAIAGGVSAMAPPERGWRRMRRADGRMLSLSMTRLPNGATIVRFADLTDLERFEALQRETAQAPAQAARA